MRQFNRPKVLYIKTVPRSVTTPKEGITKTHHNLLEITTVTIRNKCNSISRAVVVKVVSSTTSRQISAKSR